MCERNPIQCIVPPYITERLLHSVNPAVRSHALATLKAGVAMRTRRQMSQAMPTLMAVASATKSKDRQVFDAHQTDQLPGTPVRSESKPGKSTDPAVNEAFDYSGFTYDFYKAVFKRNSLDDDGMTLKSSVHVAEVGENGTFVAMNNAFWDGEQMAYGDGDGLLFQRFTRSLDVVAHELTHGVESFTSNLTYQGQSGALNEHFADVFGALVRQWKQKKSAAKASWLIGAEVLVPAPTRRAIRDMENPGTAFVNDPELGTDPQPAHMSNLFTGPRDRGGVHINSGIPNRAFVLTAKALKGNAWGVAGTIWYETMVQLTTSSQFQDCADLTYQVAQSKSKAAATAVKKAWAAVGITV